MGIEKVKFRGRHNSARAVLFLVTGSLTIITLIAFFIFSAVNGAVGFPIGLVAMLCAILSLVGLIVSAKATNERDIYTLVPIIGTVVNGISLVIYIIVYVMGLL